MRHRHLLLVCAAVAWLAAACAATSSGADKAGNVQHDTTVVLRIGSTPGGLADVPPVADFVRTVARLSSGTIQIEVTNQWGNFAPDAEADVVRKTELGTLDLGWAGSRVFDTLGDPAFAALSVAMLIDSHALANAVLRSDLPNRMLASLPPLGLTGLALLGDELRFPVGVRNALLAPSDWRGLSIGTYRSRMQEDAVRALGATPVVAFGPYRNHYVANGTIQGFEFDVRRYAQQGWGSKAAPYVTINVALWPQFDVLFANPDRLASLTDQQRGWLEEAAHDAAPNSSGDASDRDPFIGQACAAGAHFVLAPPSALAALHRAFAPLYRSLERDRQTSEFLREIQNLKQTTPPGAGFDIPPACARTS
jgi:TRAP-type C4-dicarboxylate transport system substrate-binding protein